VFEERSTEATAKFESAEKELENAKGEIEKLKAAKNDLTGKTTKHSVKARGFCLYCGCS